MSEEIMQGFDQYSDQPRFKPEVEKQMIVTAAEQFIDDCGDAYYPTDKNWSYISGWLFSQAVPITRRNLMVAFRHLSEKGFLETRPTTGVAYRKIPPSPEDRGVQTMHSGLILRHNTGGIAENQLLRERPERLQELLGDILEKRASEDAANRELAGKPGQPISPEFKATFYASLAANKWSPQSSLGAARAYIALHHEGLDPHSQEFSRLVAELINVQK